MAIKRRWLGVVLLFFAGIINFIDRNALPIAAPLVVKEFGFTPSEMGIVFSSFFIGYTLFCFVGGWASDRFGPWRVFAVAMLFWSVACGFTAAAVGFASLILVRILFGMGEGPFTSCTSKFVSNWFPRKEAASALAVANAGTPVGGAIAGPVIGLMIFYMGWRPAFVAVAILGIVWLIFWLYMSRNTPRDDARVTEQELKEIEIDQPSELLSSAQPLRSYLKQPRVLATAFAFFGLNYTLYFFLSWYPSYLTSVHGLDLKSMGWVMAIPWTCAFIGMLGGGMFSDWIYRRTGRLLFSRKIVLISFLGSSAIAIMFAGIVPSFVLGVALTSLGIFLLYMTATTYWTILQAVVPKTRIGGVGGFVHALANIAGVIGPVVTGFIVQWTGSYTSAFVLAGIIAVLGACAVLMFVRSDTEASVEHPGHPVAE
ncbi:MFS transporter [Pantoea sp. Ap-967]|uniref:MFS transporter n=1 Tax=Pantoea sp. Ap-967 TaxID=2608362 RepID=UPI00142002A2|nr:MFS transporter [Pantoea sp. Ap-967]NIE73312.1 MFS transporter [Pantoea sp. Ap-967]